MGIDGDRDTIYGSNKEEKRNGMENITTRCAEEVIDPTRVKFVASPPRDPHASHLPTNPDAWKIPLGVSVEYGLYDVLLTGDQAAIEAITPASLGVEAKRVTVYKADCCWDDHDHRRPNEGAGPYARRLHLHGICSDNTGFLPLHLDGS